MDFYLQSNNSYNRLEEEFLNDWWEGERYVRVNGIQGISGIKCENI